MEEVDTIILETLKALNCDLPEEISSLRQFDEDIVILCVSTCLETIIPSSKFPKKLSPSMAIRLKTASYLAEQIKDIGYRDEIGYQTLLYFNETEIRRLFIFLIEKLPKDPESSVQTEDVGYIAKLLRDIKKNLIPNPIWIPSSLHYKGTHSKEGHLEMRSYGNSCPLNIKKLTIPSSDQTSEGFRDYYVNILPAVTKQCSPNQLIPSLLFEDCKFSRENKDLLHYLKSIPNLGNKSEISSSVDNTVEEVELQTETELTWEDESTKAVSTFNENTVESLNEELEVKQTELLQLKKSVESDMDVLSELNEVKQVEEKRSEELKYNLNIKKKTMEIVSSEENIQKLKDVLVSKSNSRLMKMNQKWNEIKQSLIQKQDNLQSILSEKESKLQEKEVKLKHIMATYEEMRVDFKNKVELEKKLVEKHKNAPQNINRSTYTNNIIEIIGNIKKQNHEIQKILQDTKQVQKDINTLSGQIDRSFTISDELIFLHAKEDETSKKAYKLLVSLHNECGEIVKILSDIGFVERECRNLQEQLDIEAVKQTSVKLQRVTEDLQKIREENVNLQKQVQ
ncbi:coiled-coil domain-containing protein 22 homolog [Coccinella septempunctata]|uniref:coiled-coil domain-containing protein 22 homolog n=1 Tax=Coccinella septempunctata TaxID=41139 RepID=UPI001D06DB07|nr:coiled-coil domain-containing protein 22 homolog [Coccinella septempunctata]